MNFQVPQFIEQKAKIIGPLTLIQFAYVAAAAGISFLSFYVFTFTLWFFISAIAAIIAIALAFVKVNGQDLPKMLVSAFGFAWKPRVYTWQRVAPKKTLEVPDFESIENLRKNMSIQEKLKDIALNITTGKIFMPKYRKGEERYQAVTLITGEKKIAKRVDY